MDGRTGVSVALRDVFAGGFFHASNGLPSHRMEGDIVTVHWPSHPHVPHPNHLLPVSKFNDWVAGRLTRILGSAIFFYICFTVPLAVLPGPTWAKTLVNILSSAWIQLWALAVLQMGQNKADDMRKAMAEATYRALTHVATVGDANHDVLGEIRYLVAALAAARGIAAPGQSKAGV